LNGRAKTRSVFSSAVPRGDEGKAAWAGAGALG